MPSTSDKVGVLTQKAVVLRIARTIPRSIKTVSALPVPGAWNRSAAGTRITVRAIVAGRALATTRPNKVGIANTEALRVALPIAGTRRRRQAVSADRVLVVVSRAAWTTL